MKKYFDFQIPKSYKDLIAKKTERTENATLITDTSNNESNKEN